MKTKLNFFFTLFSLIITSIGFAQNGIIGDGFSPVSGQDVNWSTTKTFASSIGATRVLTVFPNATGNRYFRLVRAWGGDWSQFGPANCVDSDWSNQS